MTEPKQEDPRGPVESGPWPHRLPGHVATPTSPRRVHGYELVADLSQHYNFGEVVATLLAGTPPTRPWGTAINLALTILSETSVAEAPVHSATLARRCTAPPRVALAIGVLGLLEQADALLGDETAVPEVDATVSQVWSQLPDEVRNELDECPPKLSTLALEILKAAGISNDTQLLAALVLARLPLLAAEVDAVQPGDVRGYPMRLPDYEYEGSDE